MRKRHQFILNYVETYEIASVQELAEQVGASVETIRRDLNLMAEHNLFHRIHGGAVSHKYRDIGRSFQTRQRLNNEAKKQIAAKALSYIQEGMTIGLDASSSSWYFAQMLPDIRCTVITSSMHNIRTLSNKTAINIIATGGTYSPKYDAFYGSSSGYLLSRFQIDVAIFSCTGLCNGTIWESNEMNAVMKRKMLAVSEKKFLLLDHSKYERKDLITLCDLAQITHLFSDNLPPQSIHQYCDEHHIPLIV
ncbi:DeoR faimly transcriptional regulator [[Actinobacillus] muris]|uniref:DeoR faimly transcriptional regulator n=1 Tax=Muribacter muris TaxID=67855 RepID=A0A0J5P5B8_9PAST|nr:DeoR/GlpR family DNA-binding transcription regulator [Muribacter muris]KMK50679.1 DeoR faimly transcriptional regulator [[Actinobacillus] muris] [Muribacter muris]